MFYSQRGTLTEDQLKLVMRHLPVETSFADEDDVLRFWSGTTYATCDARYVGRDVRDCHPEDSLPVLERILAEFKAGTRDVAEGWHRYGDSGLRYTSYTAVRDAHGTYKGILEMNADLTRFRAFDGERSLPGW
jgi:uncharacterized protein